MCSSFDFGFLDPVNKYIKHCYLLNIQHYDRYWIYLQVVKFHVLSLISNFYIKITFKLYLPYLIVDLPSHVCKVRKNGKKYTNKDQAQACGRCTWQRNSSQAMGKLLLLRLSWVWGPLPPAQASVLKPKFTTVANSY